ncbi:MAG: DNA alkylation repair protein [Bdellovibrionales bacterium]|nr:DNA alkylation repair protein [Bdellovibrionales bacterium]
MEVQRRIKELADPKIAEHSLRFFKTGKGEYGYGDRFLGIRVPVLRKLAQEFTDLSLEQTRKLIRSKFHEERLTGLIILANKYQRASSDQERRIIYQAYVREFEFINNWDLVDVSAPHVVGRHLLDKERKQLYRWAKSPRLWTRRISIVSTLWFIRSHDLEDSYRISELLLRDSHDLIHKAVGWVLREAGKKDMQRLEKFLRRHGKTMPRTMLRYAIERFPEGKRQTLLKLK